MTSTTATPVATTTATPIASKKPTKIVLGRKHTCPYGCSQTFDNSHTFCFGKDLPPELVIDLKNGRRGGLDSSVAVAKVDHSKHFLCDQCHDYFPQKHIVCKKIPLPDDKKFDPSKGFYGGQDHLSKFFPGGGSSSSSKWKSQPVPVATASQPRPPNSEISYKRVLHWTKLLEVCVDGAPKTFKDLDGLIDHFLIVGGTTYNFLLVYVNPEWIKPLLARLKERAITHSYTYREFKIGRLRLCDLSKFGLSSLADFEGVSRMLFELTGINLIETGMITLQQLGYKFWKTTHSYEIEALTGDDYTFSQRAYYGARIDTPVIGQWRSCLAEEIEDQVYSFDEIIAEESDEVKIQVDGNSCFPAVERGLDDFPVYYPVGKHRSSDDGKTEYEKGVCGLYEVNYQRPENLPIGVLPSYDTKGKLQWLKTHGWGTGIYTDVDLRLAQSYGYKVEFLGKCIVWDERSDVSNSPMKKYVETLFNRTLTETDKVKRGILKTLLRTLHGKFGQKESGEIDRHHKKLTMAEVRQCNREGTPYARVNGEYFLKSDATKEQDNTKPNHLGCFVLSWYRKLMMRYLEVIEYVYDRIYSDSIRVSAQAYRKLVEAGYMHESRIGLLKVEYGLIYDCEQVNCNTYTLKYLTKDNELGVVEKGESVEERTARFEGYDVLKRVASEKIKKTFVEASDEETDEETDEESGSESGSESE